MSAEKSNIASRLSWAKDYLNLRSVPNARLDAELIMAHILGRSRFEVHAALRYQDNGALSEFEHLIRLRGKRYPLQYITGSSCFMGLELEVGPGVFIPRPETELLVEIALVIARRIQRPVGAVRILDLCAGCGNIAITLRKCLGAVRVTACDISDEALRAARRNAASHGCGDIETVKGDLFGSLGKRQFDLIVSNPPYVAEEDFKGLMPELHHEPSIALSGGTDGLEIYKRLFREGAPFLGKDGSIVLEMGYGQQEPIKEIADSEGYFVADIVKDYNGIDRILVAGRRNG